MVNNSHTVTECCTFSYGSESLHRLIRANFRPRIESGTTPRLPGCVRDPRLYSSSIPTGSNSTFSVEDSGNRLEISSLTRTSQHRQEYQTCLSCTASVMSAGSPRTCCKVGGTRTLVFENPSCTDAGQTIPTCQPSWRHISITGRKNWDEKAIHLCKNKQPPKPRDIFARATS